MKNSHSTLLAAFMLLNAVLVFSNDSKAKYFSKISSQQGLSHSTVISIAQDKNEIMWFATFDGLNRYNGYDIKVYRNERGNDKSLMHDVLRTLFVDSEGLLWIGNKGGLSRYVAEEDNFRNYHCPAVTNEIAGVNSIIEFDNAL